jgi:membrane protease YdiL (CAAX protease family)
MMAAMKPARRFTATVLLGSFFLALAAFIYVRLKAIPAGTAVPLAAAFLVEFPFYLLPGFRIGFELRRPHALAAPLTASCVLPYLIYSIPTGQFSPIGFVLLIAIAAALSFWFVLLPKHPATDLLFLAFAASVYISKVFEIIFTSPVPKLQMSVLGHAMLIRTCALAILAIRGLRPGETLDYRFLPTARECLVGLKWFAALVPACALALYATGLGIAPHAPKNAWLIAPEFFGIFWFVALSEEFAFRGLLQQWFEKWTHSGAAGLTIGFVLFGAAHLGFNRIFPNWRFAIVAAVFGLFCGLAWRQTRTLPSAMVTHALGATLYRVFFQ